MLNLRDQRQDKYQAQKSTYKNNRKARQQLIFRSYLLTATTHKFDSKLPAGIAQSLHRDGQMWLRGPDLTSHQPARTRLAQT